MAANPPKIVEIERDAGVYKKLQLSMLNSKLWPHIRFTININSTELSLTSNTKMEFK
jgi:hypothetical protein